MNELEKAVLSLSEKIKELEEVKRLKELNTIIDNKYADLILEFNKAKSEYDEAKKYDSYYPGFEQIKERLQKARIALNSKQEVIEYKRLERRLDEILRDVSKKIKEGIL